MSSGTDDPKVAEALSDLQQYLSDSISPLVVANSVKVLLEVPTADVAAEIREWAASQHRRLGSGEPISEYLCQAVRKLHLIGELTLVPRDEMTAFLEALRPRLLELCPEAERGLLRERVAHLGDLRPNAATPSPRSGGGAEERKAPAVRETAPAAQRTTRTPAEFARLADRMARLAIPDGPGGGPPSAREDVFARLVAMAACDASDPEAYTRAKESLRAFGMGSSMGNVFRALGRRLPGWALAAPGRAPGASAPGSATAQAMRRIVALERDPLEAASRFDELVEAAVERFNGGFLGSAAAMFDVAGLLLAERRVEPTYVRGFRGEAHDRLDQQRLRRWAEDPASRPLLRRVLAFFPALTPARLLDALRLEEKRERRHLLLALLEVHGDACRAPVAERLAASIASSGDRETHYLRNLLYVLRRLPRPEDGVPDAEVQTAIGLSALGHPAILQREAVAYLGQIMDERAERALVGRVGDYEAALVKAGMQGPGRADLLSVLDRAVFALARMTTPGALRAVVNHGLSRDARLGDTAARLAPLATTDFSGDPEAVSRLALAIEAELPRRVLGVVIKKDWSFLRRLVEVVTSSAKAQPVRDVLADMVRRYPDEEFARVAARALAAADAPPAPASDGSRTTAASGDLEPVGVPALLQDLSRAEATGVLTVRDPFGTEVAAIEFDGGRVRACSAGDLHDDVALYQLVERPAPGTYQLTGPGPARAAPGRRPAREVAPIVAEAIRRHDEFQLASMLVPDHLTLGPTGTKPTPPPEEGDPMTIRALWQRASSGVSALECEKGLGADSYRVRRILAHWVEEGSLDPR